MSEGFRRLANICYEYATKRYRSNCINWGLVPFTIDKSEAFDYADGDWIYVPGIRQKILDGEDTFNGKVITKDAFRILRLIAKASVMTISLF